MAGLGLLWLLTACAVLLTLAVAGYNFLLAPRPPTLASLVALADTPRPVETIQPSETAALPTTKAPPVATEEAGPVQPGCETSWLFVHERVFRVEPLPRNADGSVTVPAGNPGVAYWLEGTPVHYAFGLSRTPENVDLLAELQVGEPLTLLWRGCLPEEATLLAVEDHLAGEVVAYNQEAPGVTLFMQEEGAAVAGQAGQAAATNVSPQQATETGAPEGQIQPSAIPPATEASAPTSTSVAPPPGRGEIEAEVGFLGKQVTDSTITVEVSIYNYGANDFSVYMGDVYLIPPNQDPVLPVSADPELPYPMAARSRQTFSFSFPNPGGNGIVFQIFEVVEFDLDDF
jgi:hypothetical protein